MLTSGLLLGGLASLAAAQFPPKIEGVTVLKSKFHENVTISYKEPGICETTPGVKSYSGHVHLPPGFLNDVNGESQDYPINTFFWFFESRKDPENAPLAIWLNGGPGGSSLMGGLQENGPCLIAEDSKTSYLNEWSWNNEVNLLFIDEPVQVGLSYDVPTNFTMDLSGEDAIITPADFSGGVPATNWTSRVGTLSSQQLNQTTSSTAQAAHALWHFAQTWFFEFPAYKPNDDRISLWAESYGGHYGPGFMSFFQKQNEKIANGTIEVEHAQYLHLDTLGIVNGLIDAVLQEEAYISFPYNNTYGVQVFNESVYEAQMDAWTRPGGCKEQLLACQDQLQSLNIDAVKLPAGFAKDACDIPDECSQLGAETYIGLKSRGWYDIAHPAADPFPPPHMHGYMIDGDVLGALGSPVNFSSSSRAVAENFGSTFDIIHGGFLDAIGYLLDSGVKVHMMYGDRDYACNWVGGERASLAVPYAHADAFAAAGYTPLLTPDGFSGMTRQHGNYSFTRVFQSGHEVPSYQPAASYEIFMRATFNRDMPTGLLPVTDELSTIGVADTWHIKNEAPEYPEPKCYVLAPGTCEEDVWAKVVSGEAIVKDYFVVGLEGEEAVDQADDAQKNMGDL